MGNFGFTRNQFGYSIGGPIIKNKLFFFSSTEWTRIRSNSQTTADIVDPAWLALPQVNPATTTFFNQFGKIGSNFQTISKVNWGQALGTTDPSMCAPLSCSAPFGLAGQYATPTDAGAGYPQNTYSTVERIDYNFSDKTTMYARYALYSESDFAGTVNNSPYIGYDTGQTYFNQNLTINLTHVFTPTFVSSTKLIYNRLNNLQPLGTAPVSPTLYTSSIGLPTLPGTNGSLIYPGYSEFSPGNAIPFGGPQNLYQIYEDLNWTKGKHQFKFGGDYIQTRDNRVFGAYENAVESLGSGDIASSIQNLLIGQLFQFQGATYPQGKYPCSRNAAGSTLLLPHVL